MILCHPKLNCSAEPGYQLELLAELHWISRYCITKIK